MAKLLIRTATCNLDIELNEGENIALALLRAKVDMPYACGGKGTCGQCSVWIDNSWQLACQTYPKQDTTITRFGWKEALEENQNIISVALMENETWADETEQQLPGQHSIAHTEPGSCIVAIDLGTTTLAAALVERESQKVIRTATAMNSQRRYGLDVLSRIRAAVDGYAKELQQLVLEDVQRLIDSFRGENVIEAVYITGNTTVEHLLLGYSCENLGCAPFRPVSLAEQNMQIGGLTATILPGISAFVGADIAAGMQVLGMGNSRENVLLLDLGTNGEMGLVADGKLYTTSAPAGPAFEGGNLSCGTGSVPGAISKVRIVGQRAIYGTIAQKPAVGICGTGVLELVSELLDNRIIDETGHLIEAYQSKGYPLSRKADGSPLVFTQQDIREVQLAKAAIRGGMDMLLRQAGITAAQIGRLYLAGGFGYYLNVSKAVRIGLIPEELADRSEAVGNTALFGCIAYGCSKEAKRQTQEICQAADYSNLAEMSEFEQQYLQYMNF